MTSLVKGISFVLENLEVKKPKDNINIYTDYYTSLLIKLKTALESQNGNDISHILKELFEISQQEEPGSLKKEIIDKLSDDVMMAEYENAINTIDELIKSNLVT